MKLQLKESPYHYLLDDPQFKLWMENLERGSTITAHEYWRRMGRICAELKVTPKQLGGMNEKEAGEFLLRMISHWEDKGSMGTNIKNYTKPLKSWWAFNDIVVRKKIKIQGANDYAKYENERIPTKEELSKILNAGDLRAKAATVLIAFAGCRIEVLGNYVASDGLKISDLPDLVVESKAVEFKRSPAMIAVRKTLSKSRNRYFTFLPDQGCQYLKEYLEFRMRRGEKITADSTIITASGFNPQKVGQYISTTKVSALVRKAVRGAGFDWRPYVLRRYFDTNLMVAESEGLIIRDWRSFFMGHQGDVEHTYTVNKGLTQDVIDQMRDSYAKAAEKHLVTTKSKGVDKDELKEFFARQFLTIEGYGEEEIDGIGDVAKLTPKQLKDLADRKRMEGLGLTNGNRQKIVPMGDVKGLITQGWEYVTTLPTSEAVIKLPDLR